MQANKKFAQRQALIRLKAVFICIKPWSYKAIFQNSDVFRVWMEILKSINNLPAEKCWFKFGSRRREIKNIPSWLSPHYQSR